MYDRFIGAPVHGNYGSWKKKIINGPPCVPPPLESVEKEGEVVPRSRVPIDNVNYVIYEAGISLANANDRE